MLAFGKQVGVVAFISVILHVVVGEESARRLLVHLHPQAASHPVGARPELLGGYGLVECELVGHRYGVYPAHVEPVGILRVLVYSV